MIKEFALRGSLVSKCSSSNQNDSNVTHSVFLWASGFDVLTGTTFLPYDKCMILFGKKYLTISYIFSWANLLWSGFAVPCTFLCAYVICINSCIATASFSFHLQNFKGFSDYWIWSVRTWVFLLFRKDIN